MQTKKVVIFDFDGTLADTFDTVIGILNDNKEYFKIDGITDKEKVLFRSFSLPYFLKEFGVGLFKLPIFVNRVRKLLSNQLDNVELFPGIKGLLDFLDENQIGIGIVTSNSVQSVRSFLIQNNINSKFGFVISSSSLFGKARVLRKILRKQKIDKSNCIYVGDEERDVLACKEINLPICAVSYGYNSHELLQKASPNYLCSNVSDIKKSLVEFFNL